MDSTSDEGKPEECPQGLMCKWQSHPHFKRFTHTHLNKFMENPSIIPETLPLQKHVYLHQIEVLKSLAPKPPIRNCETTSMPDEFLANVVNELKSLDLADSSNTEVIDTENQNNTMLEKLVNAAPYNIFFNRIAESEATFKEPNAITFTDLLCPSLGSLKSSLQFTFLVKITWLMEQYKLRNLHHKPLTIIYGYEKSKIPDEIIAEYLPNVTYHYVDLKKTCGIQHSKIGIYLYDDNSLRVAISTANLYIDDWDHYNNGLWFSPSCPRLPAGSSEKDGESPTKFKNSLVTYLRHYSTPCLRKWIDCVKKADFSAVRVFLVTSVPGGHYPKDPGSHLHRVSELLSKHCLLPVKTTECAGPNSWHILAQASSIGAVDQCPPGWIRDALWRSLAAYKNSELTNDSDSALRVIYPTFANVMDGYLGENGGQCLGLYEYKDWFHTYLHQWKADDLQRTKAMPHIKTYCRISPCLTKLAWFLLTSANISKSAWGSFLKRDLSTFVKSYEAGVLFLPEFFEEEYFEIKNSSNMRNKQLFPFIYDLPLTPYKSEEYPWCRDSEMNVVVFE